MAFPIKMNGKIVTTGSSPNGPCKEPKIEYYKNAVLKALIWTDSTVAIKDYNPQTGSPLTDVDVPNGFVTYCEKDHPIKVQKRDYAGRFLLVGVSGENVLMILTVNNALLDIAARHLRQLGAVGDILTLSSNLSMTLYNHKKGIVVPIQTMAINAEPITMPLPHFLLFLKK